MARPVTLFTGQWANLPLEKLAKKAASWGYDGLELACWGDHFDVDRALSDRNYCKAKRALLKKYGLKVFAISKAVCDNIDERHKAILPPDVWGDGETEGVRKRAAQKVIDAAKAAKELCVKVVNDFANLSVWRPACSIALAVNPMGCLYQNIANRQGVFKPLEIFKMAMISKPQEIIRDGKILKHREVVEYQKPSKSPPKAFELKRHKSVHLEKEVTYSLKLPSWLVSLFAKLSDLLNALYALVLHKPSTR